MERINTTPEIIHLVLGKANPNRMNGVNKVVFQLATQQALAGKKVSVWGITRNPEHTYEARAFHTRLFRKGNTPFGISRELKQALTAKKDTAVFHLHGGWIPAFYTIAAVLHRCGARFVITPHGAYNTIAMQRNKWIKKLHFQFFEKVLLSRASKIHCIGQSEVTGTNCLFPAGNTFLQPYGFEAPAQTSADRETGRENFILGFVGRIDVFTKGLDLLLQAFSTLQQQEKNSVLWIVGDGDSDSLKKLIDRYALQDAVTCWGGKFGSEKETLMQQMHVFAHPSRNEGLPASVLEAAAAGIVPVVTQATNLGMAVEHSGCGIVVDDEDADALTRAFFTLKKEWERNGLYQRGNRAVQMVKQDFSWHTILHGFDQLYQPA